MRILMPSNDHFSNQIKFGPMGVGTPPYLRGRDEVRSKTREGRSWSSAAQYCAVQRNNGWFIGRDLLLRILMRSDGQHDVLYNAAQQGMRTRRKRLTVETSGERSKEEVVSCVLIN